MSFPRYPSYKETLVPWMDVVPISWTVQQAKRGIEVLTDFTANGSFASLAENVEYRSSGYARLIRMTDLRNGLKDEGVWVDESAYRYLAKSSLHGGELLMASVGSVGLIYLMPDTPYPATLAPNMYLLKTREQLDERYFYWFLNSASGQDQITHAATVTAQPKLNKDNVRSLILGLPSMGEQQTISLFLDHETAKIDALIQEQERLIQLLQEKRQAEISQAETKGLNPDAPLKDSGVEWLGQVPTHWDVIALKYLISEKVAGPYGASLTKSMYSSEGYRVFGQQQVISDDFTLGDYYISEEKYEEMQRYTVYPGDILITVMGTVGKVSVVPDDVEPGIINPRLVRYKFNPQLAVPGYVKELLLSLPFQGRLKEAAQGSTMDGLNMGILGDLPILVPSTEEQKEIAGAVRFHKERFDSALASSQELIQLLKERRSALISAAVTGKIDVRDWQPPVDESAFDEEVRQAGLEATA